MPDKNTNNYNKNYFTTRGIPQPGAETDTEQEKHKVAQSDKEVEESASGPGENAEIARAMGRKKEEDR